MDAGEVYKIAEEVFAVNRFGRYKVPKDDLVQNAVLKVLTVEDRFDPARGKWRNFVIRVCINSMRASIREWFRWGRPSSLTLESGEPRPLDTGACIRLRYLTACEKPQGERILPALVVEKHHEGMHNAQIARVLGIDPASVTRILQRAGLKPHHWERRKLDYDEIRRLGAQGLEREEIGRILGCSASAVWKALRKIQHPGAVPQKRRFAPREKILALAHRGKSRSEIAHACGVSFATVWRHLESPEPEAK